MSEKGKSEQNPPGADENLAAMVGVGWDEGGMKVCQSRKEKIFTIWEHEDKRKE